MPLPPINSRSEDHQKESARDLEGSPDLDAAHEEMPTVEPPKPRSNRTIKVTANRAGFIHQHRKVAGDKFEVHEHQLSDWMDCDDPVEHKKFKQRHEAHRRAVNAAAIAEDKRDKEAVE
jgi:hypothetical protein